jgi:hypothetical protein
MEDHGSLSLRAFFGSRNQRHEGPRLAINSLLQMVEGLIVARASAPAIEALGSLKL